MLRPIEKTKVYIAAVEQIKAEIESGEWAPGARLPSERDLAEQLGVGRPSIREAMRILEALGLIEIRLGQGSYVKEKLPGEDHARLLQSMLAEDSHVVQLLEVREMLEPQIAALAAQSASEDDLRRLHEILERMEESVAHDGTGAEVNIEFHLAITKSVGNEVLYEIHQLLLKLSKDPVARFFQVPGRPSTSMEGHREVLKAIQERNPPEAQRKMLQHLRTRYAIPDSLRSS